MKILCLGTIIVLFASCTSVTTQVSSTENDQIVMNSIEDSCFSSPKEKLKFTFSPKNGGQIYSIYWEGTKVADAFSESYPNPKLDIKNLKPRVLDDGSGLVIVDSNVRGKYQLRRSYSLKYLQDTDEHLIEVIYNVKNYSAEMAVDQQWIQSLSISDSLKVNIVRSSVSGINEDTLFQIETFNVNDLTLKLNDNKLSLSNAKSFKLGTKERLSWKVLYKLKTVD